MQTTTYQPELDAETEGTGFDDEFATSDWRGLLPVLHGAGVTLPELRASDAASLFAMLASAEVARFISPPPTSVEGFERFIGWTHRERAAGRSICFGVVPRGKQAAIGIIQARALDANFATAEWGFAVGSPFWSTGIFQESAKLAVTFLIDTVGVHRLEARAAVSNGRGNRALQKLGATQDAVLRKSFSQDGQYFDQVLWSIVDDDWFQTRAVREPSVPTRPSWADLPEFAADTADPIGVYNHPRVS